MMDERICRYIHRSVVITMLSHMSPCVVSIEVAPPNTDNLLSAPMLSFFEELTSDRLPVSLCEPALDASGRAVSSIGKTIPLSSVQWSEV
jgi:hypothetical protein